MIKGDLRKSQILEVSEELFCKNGYEKTSVQDILDVLKLSKGSFYHHFESKEQLLHNMCISHACEIRKEVQQQLSEEDPAVLKINKILSGMIPLHGNGFHFLAMIIPVFFLPEGRSVKISFCDALKDAFRSDLSENISIAARQHIIFSQDTFLNAEICLDLMNDLWLSLCAMIVEGVDKAKETNRNSTMINTINTYRTAIENVLTLPYGALDLIKIYDLNDFISNFRSFILKTSINKR